MRAGSRSAAEAGFANDPRGQLVRFAVAGAGITFLSALLYAGLAGAGADPFGANTLATLAGAVLGYQVHGRWSFRGERRDGGAALRFAGGAGVGYGLNSLWVWATLAAGLPAGTAVPFMVFATPLLAFALNRCWVFRPRTDRPADPRGDSVPG